MSEQCSHDCASCGETCTERAQEQADFRAKLNEQSHVKKVIAPYKYPRRVIFATALPKTATGKLQRFRLKEGAAGGR